MSKPRDLAVAYKLAPSMNSAIFSPCTVMVLSHFPRKAIGIFENGQRAHARATRSVGIDPGSRTVDGTFKSIQLPAAQPRRCRLNPVSDGALAGIVRNRGLRPNQDKNT